MTMSEIINSNGLMGHCETLVFDRLLPVFVLSAGHARHKNHLLASGKKKLPQDKRRVQSLESAEHLDF